MASISAPLYPPTKWQIADALAGVLPSELSRSPLLGILGVVMGAGIVTLTGRMLTLGTADLRGNLGIGYDDGAWIGSAFNIALMFIGPFTVYLGGLLGPRRVLVIAGSCFTVICLLLALVVVLLPHQDHVNVSIACPLLVVVFLFGIIDASVSLRHVSPVDEECSFQSPDLPFRFQRPPPAFS